MSNLILFGLLFFGGTLLAGILGAIIDKVTEWIFGGENNAEEI